jgi:hypothetical protein
MSIAQPQTNPALTPILSLPIAEAELGTVHCPVTPHAGNDALFADWEAPLTWRPSVASKLIVDTYFGGRKALHMAIEQRSVREVWDTGWHLWYDRALVSREAVPADCAIRGTFAVEEVTTGYGSDNNVHVNPWVGIVARMQDVRRYYFLCLEYPNAVTLYRREDDQWVVLARSQQKIGIYTPYALELRLRGSRMEGYLNGECVLKANDYHYEGGKAGIRANCVSFAVDYAVYAETAAVTAHVHEREVRKAETALRASGLPKPVLAQVLDLSPLGGKVVNTAFGHISAPGGPMQCLASMMDVDEDRPTLNLLTLEGETVWATCVPGMRKALLAPPAADGHRDILGMTREEVVKVDGRTGDLLARCPRPISPGTGKPITFRDVLETMANLTGGDQPDTCFLMDQSNDPYAWALNLDDLSTRWMATCLSGLGHGNQLSRCDVNGDGRDEVFAGGSLISADGEIIWSQAEVAERLAVPNGWHIDAAEMGYFMGPDAPPTVHMQCSSGGHVVADARTGEVLAAHPQGHVQSGVAACVAPGVPGVQVISSNRWGNYGLTGVYRGDGRRLSRFQVDYQSDSLQPVNWVGDGIELLMIVETPYRAGLYDYLGNRLIDLEAHLPVRILNGYRGARGEKLALPLYPDDPRDAIILRHGHLIHILRQDSRPAPGTLVHAPSRRDGNISEPGWRTV